MDSDLERCESQESFQKTRDRTKSVGDVPRQLFIPFLSRFQVSSSFKFHVFILLQFFLNICYFTLVTPFRFAKLSKKHAGVSTHTIQTNPLQQVLSTFVVLISIIYALLDLRYWVEKNLKETPHGAFKYASYLIRGFIPLVWFGTFWLKKKWFATLLVVCQGRKEQNYKNPLLSFTTPQQRKNVKPSLTIRVIIVILLALTMLKIVFEIYTDHLEDSKWEDVLTYNAHVILYNVHLRNWTNRLEWEDMENNPFFLSLGGFSFVFLLLDTYMENMFDLLCFIGAAMVYAVCGHFSDEMEKLSRVSSSANANEFLQSKTILRLMQTNYVDLIAILESINEVFGSLIVLYFLRSYPTLVWSVFGLFRKEDLFMAVFYVHKISVFVLVTLTAAEGNSKVHQFKQWLFHTSVAASTSSYQDDDSKSLLISINEYNQKDNEVSRTQTVAGSIDITSLNMLHREVSTEKLGLKGYKFFTVTHGLVGTICGIVVTYAIVMLQFELNADEIKRRTAVAVGPLNKLTPTQPTTMPSLDYETLGYISNATSSSL